MNSAIIFPPRGMKLKKELGLDQPQIVENVVFMEELACMVGSFIYYNRKWYVKQPEVKPGLFTDRKSIFIPAPKPVDISRVPGEYQAWTLILT